MLAPEVTVWTDAPRAALVASVLDVMGGDIRVIGVGGPRVAEVDDLARRLDCPREDDPRKMIVDRPAAFLLLASMQGVGRDELLAAAAQESTLLALDPPAADLSELATLSPRPPRNGEPPRALSVVLLPAFRHSPGFVRSADPHDLLSEQRLVAVESCGRLEASSLFARLYDAWHTVLHFTALPESIDASLAGPLADIPDDLRQLGGRLGAHARMPDGSSAVLQISDRASDERRYLHVLSQQAELRITDTGYDLRQADGGVVDRGEPAPAGIPFADLIASQWRRLLNQPDLAPPPPEAPPHRDAQALACCLACLLSARTGQPESPRKLLEMGR